MKKLKKICADCATEYEGSPSRLRCDPCARKKERSYMKYGVKRLKRSGVNCSRCSAFTGRNGICEKCSAYVLEWKRNNRDKVNATRSYRYKFGNTKRRVLVAKLLAAQGGKCNICGCKDANWHIDHVIPRHLGGCDAEMNYQILCAFCNMSKGTKIVDLRANPDQFRLIP